MQVNGGAQAQDHIYYAECSQMFMHATVRTQAHTSNSQIARRDGHNMTQNMRALLQ